MSILRMHVEEVSSVTSAVRIVAYNGAVFGL